MPMLSALDLLEARGLSSSILLLSDVEAETLDLFEQNNQPYKLCRDLSTDDSNSCKHTRSWNSVGGLRHPSTAKTARVSRLLHKTFLEQVHSAHSSCTADARPLSGLENGANFDENRIEYVLLTI